MRSERRDIVRKHEERRTRETPRRIGKNNIKNVFKK
jgi:hypothetical protein